MVTEATVVVPVTAVVVVSVVEVDVTLDNWIAVLVASGAVAVTYVVEAVMPRQEQADESCTGEAVEAQFGGATVDMARFLGKNVVVVVVCVLWVNWTFEVETDICV